MLLRLSEAPEMFAYVARCAEEPVAVALVELEGERRASFALAVAGGWRRRGLGREVVEALFRRPELETVDELLGGVHPANEVGRAFARGAGFVLLPETDEDGFEQYLRRR